jgi:hypothetical protein
MTTKTKFILKATNIIFWVIFIGLCIKTGAILISFLVSLFINSDGAKNLYLGLNLFDLFTFSKLHYVFIVSFIILLTGLQAYIAYLIVKIFLNFKFTSPFNADISLLISKISYVALGSGILAMIANAYSDWLINKGTPISQDWASSEILFFAGVIYIIAQVFKKGVEIQTENELTV